MVDGECESPGEIGIEDVLKRFPQEERIYRLRCVEAWSMVIPWVGFPLGDLLTRFKPTSEAKYVGFETLYDPEQMPGHARRALDWPYVEGLRLDEAMHHADHAGHRAVRQGAAAPERRAGAPGRALEVRLQEHQIHRAHHAGRPSSPPTLWKRSQPARVRLLRQRQPRRAPPALEPGERPRHWRDSWRQRETLLFNGYAEQVASLYTGMDLAKNF